MNRLNYSNGLELPLGLSMAMAQNQTAMDSFSKLSAEQKKNIINQTRSVHSKREMQQFVNNIADGTALDASKTYETELSSKLNM